jgi:hypothetical protein
MTVNSIGFDEDRGCSSREVAGYEWVRAFFPIRDVLQQSLGLDLKTFCALSQRVILEAPRENLSDKRRACNWNDEPERHYTLNNLTR